MNFIETISNYVLENYSVKELPNIAMKALNENIESESIYILAGMDEKDNSFEILQYFNHSLDELQINLPSKAVAAKILTKYYLIKIVENDVYKQIDWKGHERKHIGEELNLEYLYTWYREIQDWIDNGMILYFNDLSRDEQRMKFEENLLLEAKKTLRNNYTY